MTVRESSHLLIAEMESASDVYMLMNFKLHMGWEVLTLPFPTNFELVDSGEETTEAQPRTWCVILHRR